MRQKNFIYYVYLFIFIFDFSSGLVCYTCDSIALDKCAMDLQAVDLPYEECKTDLQCSTSIVDSITYRGCASTTPSVGATYKKHCNSNLCNKGVFPPGRLKCFHCTECAESPQGKPHPCLNHYEDDDCYTHIIGLKEVNRGCRSDSNRTEVSDSLIEYCNINGCNNKPATRKLTCAECDSKNEIGCKVDLSASTSADCKISQYRECEMDIILTQNSSCFLYHNLSRVIRGCTSLMPEEIRQDLENIKECSDRDFCNAACLEQQKCVVCDSEKHNECRSNTLNIPKTICGSAEISSCHTCEHDWHVQRDCGSPPVDHSDMYRCYEASFNDKNLNRCYKCSTDIHGPNCASWERPGFNIEIEECEIPGASCIIGLFESGQIVRGCKSTQLGCNDSLFSCNECNGHFCNKNKYPLHLRCYQCTGNVECAELPEDPMPCLSSSPEYRDACFEYYDNNIGMVRGCRSNALGYYQCILYNEGNCRLCYEEGCNNSAAISKSQLRCYKCNKFTQECQSELTENVNLELCANLIPFGFTDSCYITRHIDGTTSRGCILDTDREVNIFDQTALCTANACNSAATI